jgi:hypothetical protein
MNVGEEKLMNKPVVVIGEGWAALGSVCALTRAGTPVCWVSGTGAKMISPLPTLEVGQSLRGLDIWSELASSFGIEVGESLTGSFLREYRNKSFREPVWTKAPSEESRASSMEETLWAPERRMAPLFEARFSLTMGELETQLREALISEESLKKYPGLKRIEEIPVTGLKLAPSEHGREKVVGVILGSGEEIECERVIYADRWKSVPELQGLPKGLTFLRKRDPMGVLQAIFTHEAPIGVGLREGFFGPLHKEAGEDMDKHVWGYFSSDGRKSFWTICLAGEEVEDNHMIAKKLRRMKTALEKMFTGDSWLPAGVTDFMANVREEQVRFEEAVLFADGEQVVEPVHLPKIEGLSFLTDGYGASCALHQVGIEFDLFSTLDSNSQAESVDFSKSSQSESEACAP